MPMMTNVEIRLEDTLTPGSPGFLEPLELTPENGFVPISLHLGSPDVREVVSKRPHANGTFDYTNLFGNRAVTLVVSLAGELMKVTTDVPDPCEQDLEDALKAWILPSGRYWLYYKRKTMREWRRIMIRGSAANVGYNFVTYANFDAVSIGWKAPDGVIEDSEPTVQQIYASNTRTPDLIIEIDGGRPSDIGTDFDGGTPGDIGGIEREANPITIKPLNIEEGRSYDLTFDRKYPPSTPLGSGLIRNKGNAPVLPYLVIYGPCTQPRIQNVTTGLTLNFNPDFQLYAGEYLVIDFKEGTVLLNGEANNSRYNQIDFSVSDWWPIIHGVNSIRYYPLVWGDPSNAILTIHSSYL